MSALETLELYYAHDLKGPQGDGTMILVSDLAYLLRIARAAREAQRLLDLALRHLPPDRTGVSMARTDLQRALEAP